MMVLGGGPQSVRLLLDRLCDDGERVQAGEVGCASHALTACRSSADAECCRKAANAKMSSRD
jgi:hypothetical protein